MPTSSPQLPPADLGTPEIVRSITDVVLEIPADLPHDARFDDHDVDSLVLAEAAVLVTPLYRVEVHAWELLTAGTLHAGGDRACGRVASPPAVRRAAARAAPRALEDCSPEEVFQLVLRRFDERVRGETALGDAFLSDGSVLHEWVYLAGVAAAARGCGADVGPLARRATCELARGLGRRYDLVVHVPPEVPLAPSAPIDATFQAALDRRTRAALRLSGVRAVTVTGDVEERVARVAGRLP